MSSSLPGSDFHGRLEVAVRSILAPTANGRTENQDNYLIVDARGQARFLQRQQETTCEIADWHDGHCRFAILDGMGGHSQGREATECTVAGLLDLPPTSNLGELSGYLDELHLRLHHSMHKNGAEPGCTLTLLEVPASGPALLFHVGDSRLYVIDRHQVDYLTVDHVPATKFALFGLMDAREWWHHTHEVSGYQISQAFVLGSSLSTRDLNGALLEAELFELHDGNLPPFLKGRGDRRTVQLQPERTYLLASDGLWHLHNPLAFVNRWPALLANPGKPIAAQLDRVFEELIRFTAREPQVRGDNSTAIALRLANS